MTYLPKLHCFFICLQLHPSHFLLDASYPLLKVQVILPQKFLFSGQAFDV